MSKNKREKSNAIKQKPKSRKMLFAGLLLFAGGAAIIVAARLTAQAPERKQPVQISNPLYSVAEAPTPSFPAKKEGRDKFVAEFAAHQGIPTEKCSTPLRIYRANRDGGKIQGRGVMLAYSDGWRCVLTSAHIFAREYGGEAQYLVTSIEGKQAGCIEDVLTPEDMGIKTPFVPDLIICKLGERTTIQARNAGDHMVHDSAAKVTPVKLTPLEASLPQMTIGAVIDWSSSFPVFAAEEKSEPGWSGSGYINEKGQIFILSGSTTSSGEGGTLFVPSNPIHLPPPKKENLIRP